jgi:hypothetical protein
MIELAELKPSEVFLTLAQEMAAQLLWLQKLSVPRSWHRDA